MVSTEENWARQALERIALEGIKEQRRQRRWGIFFKLLGFAYVGLFLFFLGSSDMDTLGDGKPHTALVQLQGVIRAKGSASAENINAALQAAFKAKGTQGVILAIDSPGGSPVQAGLINDEIQRLRELHPQIPLYVVVEDNCLSGGYYVAVAADRIYVNQASVIGSIGVLMEGFGFTGSMAKLGVERRLLSAGDNKDFLDPFTAEKPAHKAHAEQMLQDVHQQFIDAVRKKRAERLSKALEPADDETLFSGLMWSGAHSIRLGIADELGSVDMVAREVIKAEDIRDYTVRPNLAERFTSRLGMGFGEALAEHTLTLLGRWQWR